MNKRRLKLAKAIYRKYIISGGTVAKKIKPVTKSFINERVCRSQLDSALFQQAKQEVQEVMEVEVYPVFLKSHVFLTYTQEICNEWENHQWDLNSHKQETGNDKKEPINSEQEANSKQETEIDKQEVNSKVQEPKSGKKEVQRFLPELVEKIEWAESEIVPANHKTSEHWESGWVSSLTNNNMLLTIVRKLLLGNKVNERAGNIRTVNIHLSVAALTHKLNMTGFTL